MPKFLQAAWRAWAHRNNSQCGGKRKGILGAGRLCWFHVHVPGRPAGTARITRGRWRSGKERAPRNSAFSPPAPAGSRCASAGEAPLLLAPTLPEWRGPEDSARRPPRTKPAQAPGGPAERREGAEVSPAPSPSRSPRVPAA